MHCYEISQCDATKECLAYQMCHTRNGECRKYASFDRLMGNSVRDGNGRIIVPQIRCHQCQVFLSRTCDPSID
jgi:hypothetical protein